MCSEVQCSSVIMYGKNVDVNVYRKQSMERFGDDLTEEVLQYLTL